MQRKSSAKSLLILGGIIVIGIFAYFYFTGSPQDTSSQLSAGTQTDSVTNEATQIITLLNQTSALRIDTALFNSPVYKSLVDHTVPVVVQPVGKPNPFIYTVAPPAKTK